ncbi:Ham1-like protein [Dacryopinax primogenitus]|uniref:Inosine triphosphate pyrophosphatase n=1 Tax=Dacryopinax primogenitus (strain DJM 731) TaxID=1858805 RepID=M5FMZ0_DACPD|nr:Ham1-like protein [Dacryopinax primogenitus]EJT96530.1 Ham1-like protein [Dacryopinax primogenitus]
MSSLLHVVFVTSNPHKLKEVRAILDGSVQVDSKALDIPELQGTTREVSRAKCQRAAELLGGPCITEDTALGFDALGGLPGVYIKDFLKAIGHSGLNTMLEGFQTRAASAICTFAYSPGPGAEVVLFEGVTRGKIVPARGGGDFGWDPVFEVEGTGRTYAEMEAGEKNNLSHRFKALEKLREYLQAGGGLKSV